MVALQRGQGGYPWGVLSTVADNRCTVQMGGVKVCQSGSKCNKSAAFPDCYCSTVVNPDVSRGVNPYTSTYC